MICVVIFITVFLSIETSISTTQTPKFISQGHPSLQCSYDNKCSEFVTINVDSKRHFRGLRHLIGIGTDDSDVRSKSRRLASKVLSDSSLQNRQHPGKQERHAANAVFRTMYENNRSRDLSNNLRSSITNDYLSDNKNTDDYISGDGLKTRNTEVDSYITIYPEVTENELTAAITNTKAPHLEEVEKPLYSFKSLKKMITSPLNELSEGKVNQHKFKIFSQALSEFERKFYIKTFEKLTQLSPIEKQENGISFVQSGLFLNFLLIGLSKITDMDTAQEINECIGLNMNDTEKIDLVNEVLSALPNSSDGLKWRWSSRLVLEASQEISEEFRLGAASALRLVLDKFNSTESPEVLAATLNQMVEKDSGGAIRDAFEIDEMADARAVLLTTLYLRATWRSAPTVLNGTRPFHDANNPLRTVRMIRVNDVMRYANLVDWKFHAIEIAYSTPGLSLLMLVPYEQTLRGLVNQLAVTSLDEISSRMVTKRISVSMPIYTLRMTLLLPSKLQAMGVNRLFNWNNTDSGTLRLSHAVQGLMFWAEAGRNAYKDDGLEWDETPEMELVVDRPYLFFVRWKNLTLMNGNFVL